MDQILYNIFRGYLSLQKKNYKISTEKLENLKLDQKDIPRNVLRANILAKNYDYLKNYEKLLSSIRTQIFILEKNYLQKVNKNRYINLVEERLNFFLKKS